VKDSQDKWEAHSIFSGRLAVPWMRTSTEGVVLRYPGGEEDQDMQTAPVATNEVAILGRVFEADEPSFSPEVARCILEFRFREEDRKRMHELSAKAREGSLTPDEQAEIESYEKAGHILSLMKSKARLSLEKHQNGS
jgi:hypothetical protein